MQRQSLGSPGSKHHGINGGLGAKDETNLPGEDHQKRKDQSCSLAGAGAGADIDNDKSQKPHKTPAPKPEKFIHVIPVLTVLCFLILYLSSHDPSQNDLAQFSGFNRLSKSIDSTAIDDLGRVLDIEKGDVLAIRSLRNLQEIGKHGPKFQPHRKIGSF